MTAKRKGPMTLDQLYAQLKAEGRYDAMVERHRQQDEERQKRVAELLKAQAPLLADLRAAGYEMESVWDLVNTAIPYPKALPVLLEHLPRPYPGRVREGIARALAVPEARFAWDLYTRYYREEPDGGVKEGMAAAIAVMGRTEERINEVIALARDRRNGQSRILLLRALSRSRDPRARAALVELQADPELMPEITAILRRLKPRKR